MISRTVEAIIKKRIGDSKAIILLGARQTGKTTLVRQIFADDASALFINADEADVRALFQNISADRLKAVIGKHRFLIVDEAQRIEEAGLKMKLVIDQIPSVQLIATGSSSLELANKINEPLTGRKWEFRLYPLTFAELKDQYGLLTEMRLLPERLVFGSYPDVVTHGGDEREILSLLADSYLYRDILTLDQIKKPSKLSKLTQALAYQIGSQVSFSELARLCEMDAKTVERYISILEKAFIVFTVGSFSRNLRNELKFSKKVYFVDNGIRNAVLGNLSALESRNDVGSLWENYLISERMKLNAYLKPTARLFFWRTTAQSEIDLVEEADGLLSAFEFKWNPKAKTRMPRKFIEAYPDSSFTNINRDNYWQFLNAV